MSVLCFGELLLRLDAPRHERLVQASQLGVSFTGGEANVAVALAQWGLSSKILSRVPDNPIGRGCLNHFRRYGVGTESVLFGGDRLGILYVETGASQRGSSVVYDRLFTSFRELKPGGIDWERVLDGVDWFHFTGTAPAIGDGVRHLLIEGLQHARRRGISISFDCSYRSALWSLQEAAEVLPELLAQVDVFIGSERDAQQFFGIDATGEEALSELADQFCLRTVAYTNRDVLETGINRYSAVAWQRGMLYRSRDYEIDIVDRIGAGDAFTAGLIRGELLKQPLGEAVEFAVAAAVLKHSIPGDFALLSVDEVDRLARGESTGRLCR